MARANRRLLGVGGGTLIGGVLGCALAGCAFDSSGLTPALGDGNPPDAGSGVVLDPDARPPEPGVVCDPADPSLLACYRFENNLFESQPHDESAHGNNGLATDLTLVLGHDGLGSAMDSTPTSDVRVPDSASLDPIAAITLEAWIRPRTVPAVGRAGIVDNDGQYGMFLAPGGAVQCMMGSGNLVGPTVPIDRWVHVACTYDGTAVRVYQDGYVSATVPATGPLATDRTDGLAIGHNSPAGEPFDGAIDDLRIWSVARTDADICRAADDC
jgi:hypothetical protein